METERHAKQQEFAQTFSSEEHPPQWPLRQARFQAKRQFRSWLIVTSASSSTGFELLFLGFGWRGLACLFCTKPFRQSKKDREGSFFLPAPANEGRSERIF